MFDDDDDLMGPSPDDAQYLEQHRQAFKRQEAARKRATMLSQSTVPKDLDESDEAAVRAHMEATRRALGQQANPSVPEAAAPAVAPAIVSILHAQRDIENNPGTLRQERYAPDWATMHKMIAFTDGAWFITRHELPNDISQILGFLGQAGWEAPPGTAREKFEAIVKGGKVFRSDPSI